MIVASTILFLTAIGCQKKVDTSLKAQPSIVEYTCISDSDSDKSFYVILKNYHGAYWETVIEGVSKAANEIHVYSTIEGCAFKLVSTFFWHPIAVKKRIVDATIIKKYTFL